jgi:peptide chain release factor 1
MITDTNLKNILKEYNQLELLETEANNNEDFKKLGEIKKKISRILPLVEKIQEYFNQQDLINWINGFSEEEKKDLLESKKESENLSLKIMEEIEEIIVNNEESHLNNNIFLEIRAGTGGDEASLFAGELYGMYKKYAQDLNLRIEEIDTSYNEVGGIKSISVFIKGDWAFKYFQFESGGHRVQRIPVTEKKGRVHTSTVTVAVLPEEEGNTDYFHIKDVQVEYSTAQGAGGQHVNKTESAVILTHLPTGMKVKIQDERSQHKNKEKAFKILQFRVKEHVEAKEQEKLSEERWAQVGTGARNEKIRTYNFPQNRLTDHRFALTVHNLPNIMLGEFKNFFQQMLIGFRNKVHLNKSNKDD